MNVASVSTLKGWRKVKSVFHIRVIALTLKLDLIGSILMLLVAVMEVAFLFKYFGFSDSFLCLTAVFLFTATLLLSKFIWELCSKSQFLIRNILMWQMFQFQLYKTTIVKLKWTFDFAL